MELSIIIPTFNEEKNIKDCLKSIGSFADEVIIVDMYSTDKTLETAKKFGARVYQRKELENKIQAIQDNINYGINKAKNQWIMRLDADERLTPEFKKELELKVKSGKYEAFLISRKQWFIDGFLKGGDWAKSKIVRVFKKGIAAYDLAVSVHEKFKVLGKIGEIKAPILHYSHKDIVSVMKRFNEYTDAEAIDKAKERRNYFYDMITQPIYVFLRTMTIKGGWKDGTRGVVAGLIWAFYQFLSYAKAWERKNKSKSFSNGE